MKRFDPVTLPIGEYIDRFVRVATFIEACRVCPNFGTTWSCPPYDFDVETYLRSFREVELHLIRVDPEPGSSSDDLYRLFFDAMDELTASLSAQHRGAVLGGGPCRSCTKCTRGEGLPCRNPDARRYSVESLGGDVGQITDELFHTPIRWASPGQIPEYMLLLGGILIR